MMKFSPILAALLLSGCVTTMPVATNSIQCNPPAAQLAFKCTEPAKVPENATFSNLVDVMRTDRESLRECSISLNALNETLKSCKQAIDQYNQKVDEANASKKN